MSESAAVGLGPEGLAAALDGLPDGLVIIDVGGTIRYVNPPAAALLGRSVDRLIGVSMRDDPSGALFDALLARARSAGAPVLWQGFHLPAGRRLSATAVLVADLLQVFLRDIGERPGERTAELGETTALAADPADDRDRLRYLAEVSESLIATLDTGESATQLATLAVSRLCDWAVVALPGEDGAPAEQAWAHRDPAHRADLRTYLRGRLPDTGDDVAMIDALQSGEPVQVNPIREELVAPSLPTEVVRAAWRRLRSTSTLIVPLRARGQTFGALAMVNSGSRPPHTEAEIATAVEVARRGALALDNARLYGRQLKVAETLQNSLLTPPPRQAGLEIVVRYRPAATYQQVGGDWYDAFEQPDGATMLVIGDVVGHDVGAAAAMGQIRSILRGIAFDRPESPAQVLTRVDRVLSGLRLGTLATALVGRLEQPAAGTAAGVRTLRWSSAGHLPPLLLCADGTVRLLDSTPERLLGSESAGPRTDQEVALCPGDAVLLYTDGLIEHGRTGIDEGIARLREQLAELADLPLEKLCDQLLDRIGPGGADDDIALLAFRSEPPERVRS